MNVRARIDHVYFSGNRWASIRVTTANGTSYKAAGAIDSPVVGYDIDLTGDLTVHEKYGTQIKVTASKIITNNSRKGLINYLSTFVYGVGPSIAEKIVDRFGIDTYSVLELHPERLSSIPGISETKAKKIHESHMKNKVFSDLTEYLGEDATANQIQKIYDRFGTKSLETVKRDPYVLIYEIDGIGFKIADKLALSSGIANDDPKRVGAAVVHLLRKISDEGHCFCRVENLESMMRSLFNDDVPLHSLSMVLGEEIKAGRLMLVDDDKLYRSEIYEAEKLSAKIITDMTGKPPQVNATAAMLQRTLWEMEDETRYTLTERQQDAIGVPMRNRLSVITGGPGSVKSTIILGIIKAWMHAMNPIARVIDPNEHIYLCAPTGKAARRMAALTGLKARTVHQLVYHTPEKLENALVILDEASMLNLTLTCSLLKAVWKNCTLVLIGDSDQLDPIGPGNVFKDLIRSPIVPTVVLDVSHRQKGCIEKNARRINNGQGFSSLEVDSTFRFVEASKEESQRKVLETYFDCVKRFGVKDVVCVVPKCVEGQTASKVLNPLIRDKVNPDVPGKSVPGCFFRRNDRVMYLENRGDKDIYNGDCGSVRDIDPVTKNVTVEFDDGRVVTLTPTEASELTLAYAMTVHKGQGSEFRAVVISQCWEDYRMLSRALLYTAVTRAKEFVAIVGEARAINCAVQNNKTKTRNTRLYSLIGKNVV